MTDKSWNAGRGAVWLGLFGGAVALTAACGDGGGTAKPEAASSAKAASSAAPAASTAAPGAKASEPAKKGAEPAKPEGGSDAKPATPVTTPEQQSYPMGNLKPIADDCASAQVILASAPQSVGEDYGWAYTKQAMLANQQFKTVAQASAPGEVSFEVFSSNGSYALVARCGDGSTCNRLAAMYKAVVKTSNPTLICGRLPENMSSVRRIEMLPGDPASNVPEASDTIGKCARIAACTIATKPDTTDDVGIQCQKAPTSFKTECAAKYPCAEVMACAGK